ncbi:leucine-rich repeat protein 1-like [Linepithema humile]|uniref:leucine-rich repeat protein 1-like n=1 Tax=Linepithema humile TaxID=83485 RepID=UPI00062336B5|nr:PREDICTED: leucine-rich repeat and IQ domain-containing protein 4-like [Linepithema humile]XP_012234889.1 PREDICTED: leucine-rich repeat and IQ domain-containing protein 4-like [Linepithema humile]XP_012234890.1 PREDICTED: leucine-rich repeat and IQ domain-containing protein 4-like [Linepithema humile]
MMQNKGIVQKALSNIELHEDLNEIRSKIEDESLYCFLYYSLTMHTLFRNLVNVILKEYKYILLPKEFGTLHHLQEITLSTPYDVNTTQFAWEWLEQASMRNNLKSLKIMHYGLPELPLQITCLKNLQLLDISDNKIEFLPKELGTLSHLVFLNLSSNHLGRSRCNTWEWLEQAAVRNKMTQLHLSNNQLTELSPQIGKLNALTILKLDTNKLTCLPQSLAFLKNLKELDVYNNDLLYLPGNMAHLSVYIDVDENPFNWNDNEDYEVPSLFNCSADVIEKSRMKYKNKLPGSLIRYLDNEKYCNFCGTPCFRYYEKRFVNFTQYYERLYVQFRGSPNIMNASFECYACSSECANILLF